MKDFAKSVRTNNADLGLRPVVPQLVKDIAKIYEDNGKDREKTKQELIQKHHMSERQAEDVLRQIVGNSKVGNKAIVLKDGDVWVVLYANETKSQEFKTEAEARAFASKVGNESIDNQEWSMFNGLRKEAEKELGNSTVSEYNAEIQRLTKKAEQLRRMGQGRSAMEVEKQIEKLGKELRELGNSKTGNETKAERKFGKVMGEFEEGALKTPQGKTVTDPAQAKAIAYSEADKVDNLKRARNAMKK